MIEQIQHNELYNLDAQGLEYEKLDPRFSEVVFHATKRELVGSIMHEGLRGTSEDAYRGATAWLDSFRPADKPSLIGSVYCQPAGGDLLNTSVGEGLYHATGVDMSMLAVAVDPNTAYVAPGRIGEDARNQYNQTEPAYLKNKADYREESISKGDWDDIDEEYYRLSIEEDRENSAKNANEFWKQTMSLSEFIRLYEQKRTYGENGDIDNCYWKLKDPDLVDAENGIPLIYRMPEVIVPAETNNSIEPNRILEFASGLNNG